MKTKWYVVFQFDTSYWSVVHVLCIQDGKFCDVLFWNVQLYNDIPFIFIAHVSRIEAMGWDKNWLSQASVGIPNLSTLPLVVKLDIKHLFHYQYIAG